jgi:FAD/FMN-containing dehydrogenase
MSQDKNGSEAVFSATTWQNWGRNLYYPLPTSSTTYFMPTTAQQLSDLIVQAAREGKKVRVSGQRHAQAALVADGSADPSLFLIDLSCYADLGDGSARMVIHGNQVSVNTGVREDELDAFLSQHDLMLQTVTAGGFFSIGGMTSVDVHGATMACPIFAETAIAFTIMGADGTQSTIDASSPTVDGWQPLQFARVNLGALGVVTSVTLEVLPRPYANSLTGGITNGNWQTEADFVAGMGALLNSKTRVETFFNPYADHWVTYPFMACWWDVDSGSGAGNPPGSVDNACQFAAKHEYGAPYLSAVAEYLGEAAALAAQEASSSFLAYSVAGVAMQVIRSKVDAANAKASDLWLDEAARTIFMSYFVELPDLGTQGLGIVWSAMQAVQKRVRQDSGFHVAAPLEFRFLRGGNTALAGTYSDQPGSLFVNLDLIGFAAENQARNGLVYSDKLKQFFADVERDWVALGGMPHSGKMYGFYDPGAAPGTCSEPFNPAFLRFLRDKRAARVAAFNAWRQARDPKGMFCNAFLAQVLGT